MGGKGGGSAPAAPDPNETAAAQSKYGKENALWNSALQNVNQITPYGNLTWTLGSAQGQGGPPQYDYDAYNAALKGYNTYGSGEGQLYVRSDGTVTNKATEGSRYNNNFRNNAPLGTYGGAKPSLNDYQIGGSNINQKYGDLPQWTSRITLSPEMQTIFESQMRQQERLGGLAENALGQVENAYATPYSYEGITPLYGEDDLNAARLRTEDALYSRLNPQFQRDEEALRTRLINQGIGQNSEAYNLEMERFNQMKNDARMQAVLAGGTEADRLFSQSMAARQQGITEMDRLRAQPLNEYLAMSGQQQLQNPQFQNYSYQGAPTPDYQGLVAQNYQNQMAQYNANQASRNNMITGLFGLGGQAAGGFLGSQAGSNWLAGLFG